jgi:predicted transcriptional regulator
MDSFSLALTAACRAAPIYYPIDAQAGSCVPFSVMEIDQAGHYSDILSRQAFPLKTV